MIQLICLECGMDSYRLFHNGVNYVAECQETECGHTVIMQCEQCRPHVSVADEFGILFPDRKCTRMGGCLLEVGLDSCCCQRGNCD